jgi:pimeloyl-ACP methyl ester carboxylesterase
MSRRTVNLFENPRDAKVFGVGDDKVDELLDFGPPGSLQRFLGALRAQIEIEKERDDATYEITLVGHSMGSMVINQLLKHNPALRCRNIVFLAAACSIHDFQENVIPYLQQYPDTRFYNLCLHPTAEIAEAEYWELPMRGSLLVWVDEFLGTPQTPLDRTMGRWDNFLPATYIVPEKQRGQVHVKAFPMTADRSTWDRETGSDAPQRHGDFSGLRYWEESFWTPIAAADPGQLKLITQMNDRLAQIDKTSRPTTAPIDTSADYRHSGGTGSKRLAPPLK